MKVAIVGLGGVGGYFGGRLCQNPDVDVHFLLRPSSSNVSAIRSKGLRLVSTKGDYHPPASQCKVATTAAEIGAALPQLLGFHPEQSVICLWLKCRQLVVTQRADTPDDDPADSGVRLTDYVRALFAPVWALDVDEVIVV